MTMAVVLLLASGVGAFDVFFSVGCRRSRRMRVVRRSLSSLDVLPVKAIPEIKNVTKTIKKAAKKAASEDEWFSSLNTTRSGFLSAFDAKFAYRLFHRQAAVVLKRFEERQLYVSTRRGVASVRSIDVDADAANVLFNPLAEDPLAPLRLTSINCDRASVKWKSLFTLNRDPLEVKVPSVELSFDGAAPRMTETQKLRVKSAWNAANGDAKAPTSYPPVEGANFDIDRLVCVLQNVDTPLPAFRNATVTIGLRDLEAVSVTRDGEPSNLRNCWMSFNGPFKRPPATEFLIAKRVVARDLQVTFSKEINTQPKDDLMVDLFLDEEQRETTSSSSAKKKNMTKTSPPLTQQQQRRQQDTAAASSKTEEAAARLFSTSAEATTVDDGIVSQRVLCMPRVAAMVTVGYENLEVTSIRCDTNFEVGDVDLPEWVLDDSSGNAMAFRINFGRNGMPSAEPQVDFDRLSGDATAAGAIDTQTSLVTTAATVFRSALSLFIFLYSMRLVL